MGNWGKKLRHREGYVEIDYNRRQTRVDVRLVKTKTNGLGVRMGLRILLWKKGDI